VSAPVDLSLGVADPALDLFGLRAAIEAAVASPASQGRYAPRGGLPALKQTIAALEGVSSEQTTVTLGASMALTATFAQLPAGARVLLPRPYFPAYPNMLSALGRRAAFYDVGPGSAPAEQIRRDLADGTAAAVVVTTPGNPLGNVAPAATVAEIAETARTAGALLILDETYAGTVFDPPHGGAYAGAGVLPGAVRVRSLSKRFQLPGARVGYAIGDAARIAAIEAVHWTFAMSVPVGAQLGAAAALLADARNADDPAPLRRLARLCARAESWLRRPGLALVRPRGGLMLWVEIPGSALDGRALAARLAREAGVLVAAGDAFGARRPAVRCSFAVPEAQLDPAFERLGEVLSGLAAPAHAQPLGGAA
jgi:aspartate/methionine/tyrosine aminotransferase